MASIKPVIFLAFANNKVQQRHYLRALVREYHSLEEILEKAQDHDLCELVVVSDATIARIIDVFQKPKYQNRIAIFHFAGHATSYKILLQDSQGDPSIADGKGLVNFLARQRSLKLIFLNACATQQHADALIKAGIPAVVATSESISDTIAEKIAMRFYQGLANGLSIDQAWKDAEDEQKILTTQESDSFRSIFLEEFWEEANVKPSNYPWQIYIREGAEIVRNWNLPETANNLLFGLPEPIGVASLPTEPYRFLRRYEREEAEIFFGRSFYIRELFSRITNPNSAPIILLYGQSGVGKSSLLDAGVLPRLIADKYEVLYLRRSPETGIYHTMVKALIDKAEIYVQLKQKPEQLQPQFDQLDADIERLNQILNNESLDADIRRHVQYLLTNISTKKEELLHQITPDNEITEEVLNRPEVCLEAWKVIEEESGKKLIVILDQVEEIFTRPNPDLENEYSDLLKAVHVIFGNSIHSVKGKLMLAYRKEYHPEIEEGFVLYQLARERVFLKHLNRRDIIEVVEGLTQTQKLRDFYQLNVDSNLGTIIADDLLEDKDSPISPILQILLTKMWLEVKNDSPPRFFSVNNYQQLKRDGILMQDFLDQQIEILREKYPEEVNRGLVLDILNFHTTKLGTAGSQPKEVLALRYKHIGSKAPILLNQLKDLYLLTDAGQGATGLAHDTLAPIVKNKFRESDLPGQRAARILENKVPEYEANSSLLDSIDLRIVEDGRMGMKDWDEVEQELIEKSRKKRDRLAMIRNAVIAAGVIALLVISILGYQNKIVAEEALLQAHRADSNADVALQKEAEALKSARIADSARQVAERKTVIADSARAAADSARIAEEEQRRIAELNEEIALEQKRIAELARQEAIASKETADSARAAADSLRLIAQRRLLEALGQKLAIKSLQVDEDPRLKGGVSMLGYMLYSCASKDSSKEGKSTFNSEIYNGIYQTLRHKNYLGEEHNLYREPGGISLNYAIQQVVFRKNGTQEEFYTGGNDGIIRLAKLQTNNQELSTFYAKSKGMQHLSFSLSPSQNLLAIGSQKRPKSDNQEISTLQIFDLSAGTKADEPMVLDTLLTDNFWSVAFYDETKLISSSNDGWLRIWHRNEAVWEHENIEQLDFPLKTLILSPKKDQLVGLTTQHQLMVWNVQPSTESLISLENFGQLRGEIPKAYYSLAYHPELGWLAAGDDEGNIYFWFDGNPLRIPDQKQRLHQRRIRSLAFHPEKKLFASASNDGTIQLWDLGYQSEEGNQSNFIRNLPIKLSDWGVRNDWAMAIAFSPNGKRLIASYRNKAVKVWITDQDELAESLKLHQGTTYDDLSPEEWQQYVSDSKEFPYLQGPSRLLSASNYCDQILKHSEGVELEK